MITNATNVTQLRGAFQTFDLSTPIASISFSYGGGIWSLQLTIGPTAGVSASSATTMTGTTMVRGKC